MNVPESLDDALHVLEWAEQSKNWSASLTPEQCRAVLDYITALVDTIEGKHEDASPAIAPV